MPNWKKVVTSGSDAALNSLSMSGDIIPDQDNVHTLGTADNRFQLNGGTPVTVNGSGTANTITRFQGATTVEDSKITSSDTQTIIEHDNGNNIIFIVSGSNGELVTVSDVDNGGAGRLLSVNDNAGLPMFEVSSSGTLVAQNLSSSNESFILTYNSASGRIYFASSSALGGGDDLGNHTATTTLNMSNNNISNVTSVDGNFSSDLTINVGGSDDLFVSAQNINLNNEVYLTNGGDINLSGIVSASTAVSSSNIYTTHLRSIGNTDTTRINLGAGQMNLFGGAASFPHITMNLAAGTIFNENGYSSFDFRVEGDTDTHLIFADASTDRVGIGVDVPDTLLDVGGTMTVDDIVLASSIAHEDDTDTKISFGTDSIQMATDSSANTSITLNVKGVTVNDNGASANRDFTVHGNGQSNLLLASGSANRVYIKGNNALLDKTLNVQGEVTASDVFIDDWGSVSASLANAGGTLPDVGPGAGTYGSTLNSTKIDQITLDAQGRVTNITTGATGDGDITGVTAGTNLNGGGSAGALTINLDNTIGKVTVEHADGSSSAPSISFLNGNNYGWYAFKMGTQAAYVGFAENGTEQMKHFSDGVQITSDYAFGVGVAPSTTNGRIDASNDIVAFSSSDMRWKENIKPIENALDKVSQIGGYEFDWKELSEDERETQHGNVGHDVGVIAQEIEKVLPEVVTTRDNGFMGVKYEKIVPLLIESIKELKAEIDELKRRL